MSTNLVISGGPLHDFAATTAAIVDALAEEDVRSTVFEDPRAAIAELAAGADAWDLVTVNALRWTPTAERHRHLRERWSFALGDDEADVLRRHVLGGGGLLACHAAALCFDGHRTWADLLGATWDWDRSSHPPLGPVTVSPTPEADEHPITAGLGAFATVDEVYGFLREEPGLVPLLTSPHGGVDHPVLWTRSVGRGRVVVDLLGHDVAAVARTRTSGAPTLGGWLLGRDS
ncbi:MAG: ThuA domain-containing protein [Acidimicrobiales bacterium]